ncbi:hypothetical protein GGH96_003789 [Coemansia sp. RSA 1972]|nr:hypothetical protein GGH96_003789 [Coemansia sp. RSA 1972]
MVAQTQIRPAPRCDILCVLVVESTQHMQNLFHGLYDTVITQLITQMRTPIIVQAAGNKSQPVTKATPCVRLGVVFYGDYFPYSTQTCSKQYFTSNYREFTKTIKSHRFCEGGLLRCATTEGLVGALEMFDDFAEFDPEAHLANVQQRHAIMVTSTPPYAQGCRENAHMRYDGFSIDDVARRMREMKISFSLIKERGKQIEQVEGLLKTANVSTKSLLELPKPMSPGFDVQLMGIDLQIPPEFAAPVSALTSIAPAALPNIQPQPPAPVHIQPQPIQSTASQQQQLVPQKNKVDAAVPSVDTSAMAKKPKLESQLSSSAIVSPSMEEQPKPARAKSRAKAGKTKSARASNSPAVAPQSVPATAQTTPQNMAAVPQAQTPAMPTGMQLLQAANSLQPSQLRQGQQPPAGQPAPYINPQFAQLVASLKMQGITAPDEVRAILQQVSEMQNPQRTEEERERIRERIPEMVAKAKQASNNAAQQYANGSLPAGAAAVSAPQQPTPQQQATVSPAMQSALPPQGGINQLVHQVLTAIATKHNADVRQIFSVLTPDTFESNARETYRTQPDIIANMPIIKAAFAQYKNAQMANMIKQQQLAAQNQQLSSPAMAPQGMAQQTPTQAAATVQGQLWTGMMHWESRQGDNPGLTHDPLCQIAAHIYPGINYSTQGLKLNEWPEHVRVTLVTAASEQFVEQCIRGGVQMVRISVGPNAQPEHAKYFETFCATMRENSFYGMVQFGQETPTAPPPFPGFFLTYYRNALVGLPFVSSPITSAIINTLSQFSTSGVSTGQAAAQVASTANLAVPQMTPQQSAAGLPASGLGNVSLVSRAAPMSAPSSSAGAQQMMSPQQAFAARPNLASPTMSNTAPSQIQVALTALQNFYGAEQVEAITKLPPQQRDLAISSLIGKIRLQKQQQQQQQQQQQSAIQAGQQMPQLTLQQLQQIQAQQAQFQQTSQQPLAQLFANQQMSQQSLGNIAAINASMFSSAAQQNSVAAFTSQPQDIQQMIINKYLQSQQQQRPS